MEDLNPEILPSPGQTQFDQDVWELAAWSHDEWRFDRRYRKAFLNVVLGHFRKGREFKPRPKPTTDEVWIANHNGQTIVDIANTSFKDLPADRQRETRASAQTAMNEAYSIAFYGHGQYREGQDFLLLGHFVTAAGRNIHRGWLDRNGAWAPQSQRVSFERLSPAEQKKDKIFYEEAAAIVNRRIEAGNFLAPDPLIIGWCKDDCELLAKFATPFWQPQPSKPQLVGPNQVQLTLQITNDNLLLNGVYPLDATARFVRGLCNLSPDPEEVGIRAIGEDKARRNHVGQFLSTVALPAPGSETI